MVFENDHVRVLEVRNTAGTVLPVHSHQPRVIVAIGPYRIKSIDLDGVESIIDRRPGDASWADAQEYTTCPVSESCSAEPSRTRVGCSHGCATP